MSQESIEDTSEASEEEASNSGSEKDDSSYSEESSYEALSDGDDSTSEEFVKHSYQRQTLHHAMQQHQKSTDISLSDHHKRTLYMIATYLGEAVMYCPNVNKLYYPEKQNLAENTLEATDDDLRKWLKSALKLSMVECFKSVGTVWSAKPWVEEFWVNESEAVDGFINTLVANKSTVFKQINRAVSVAGFEKHLEKFIRKLIDYPVQQQGKNFTPNELVISVKHHEELMQLDHCLKIGENCVTEAIQLLKNKGLLNENDKFIDATARRKIQEKLLIDKRSHFLLRMLIQELRPCNGNTCLVGVVSVDMIRRIKLTEILLSEPKKVAIDQNKRNFMLLGNIAFLNELPKTLRSFLPLDKELITNQLQNTLVEVFMEKLRLTRARFQIKIDRDSIKPHEPFEVCDSWARFVANLRLSNLSQKRVLRNREDKVVNRIGDFSVSRLFVFSACQTHSVTDEQVITINKNNQCARRDLQSNCGNYEAVCDKIAGIIELVKSAKNGNQITEVDIAFWIRKIIQGDELSPLISKGGKKLVMKKSLIFDIKSQLVEISYLLFGNETVRNPMIFINHQMILDLIIDHGYSFAYFFNNSIKAELGKGGYAPASSKDPYAPVKTGRRLNGPTLFGQYLPVKYDYPGPSDASDSSVVEYLDRNAHVTEHWLKNCASVDDMSDYEMVLNKLKNAMKSWYLKIDLSLLALQLPQQHERAPSSPSIND